MRDGRWFLLGDDKSTSTTPTLNISNINTKNANANSNNISTAIASVVATIAPVVCSTHSAAVVASCSK